MSRRLKSTAFGRAGGTKFREHDDMTYEIKQLRRTDGESGSYNYEIYAGGKLVARYWHDLRGDEHGIEVLPVGSSSSPVGRMTDFLEGGGRTPLSLSAQAVSYLDRKLAR